MLALLQRTFAQAPCLGPAPGKVPGSLTVVIPAYNEAANIAACLSSVLCSQSPCSAWRVLLVDEWIETGTQARAAAELVERAGGVIAGIAAIAFRRNDRTAPLWARYRCHGLWPEQP